MPAGRALPLGALRLLGVAVALGQALAAPGIWLRLPADWSLAEANRIALATAVIPLVCACFLIACALVRRRATATEMWSAAVLAVVPAVCGLFALLLLVVFSGFYFPDRHGRVLPLVLQALVMHAIPAAVLALAFHRRIATATEWTPRESNPAARALAVFGLLIVTGAWSTTLGIAPLMVVFSRYDFHELARMMNLIYEFGMVTGLLGACVAAPLASRADFRMVVPCVGYLIAIVLPIGGAVLLRTNYRVFPAGCCARCGYDLAGVPQLRCPECGGSGPEILDPIDPASALPTHADRS